MYVQNSQVGPGPTMPGRGYATECLPNSTSIYPCSLQLRVCYVVCEVQCVT